jgi:hypothetical protein
VVDLERPLPSSLPAGTATAVFLFGTCFHRREAIEVLDIVVDGARYPPCASGMPRPDSDHPRSGFWATVPVGARDRHAPIELRVAARLSSGAEVFARLGLIDVVDQEPPAVREPVPERSGPDLIAICMATFEPDMRLFRNQIDSLRAQTDDQWVCLISDDCSSPEHFERVTRAIGTDRRFAISRSQVRLGFYRNFERALTMMPAEAALVALCDQDDRWHREKLAVLRAAIGDAQLVYSDQRLVDADGQVLRDTLWKGRHNNSSNLASMLIANTITGAATLFRREVAELTLPFPDSPGFQFHDHWLGVVALAAGEVGYVDRPLYDYVQHAGAVFGDVTQRPGSSVPATRLSWRAAYFHGYLAREVQARTALLRCATRLTARKRRALERYLASSRSPAAFAWLVARSARALVGLNETLASETELARGILWKWLVVARAKLPAMSGRSMGDTRFPALGTFSQKRLRRWRARV